MRYLLLAALLTVLPSPAFPQSAPQSKLRAARSLKCTFPTTASLDWKADDAKPRIRQQDFGFVIDGIDHKAHAARLVGNVGASDLNLISGVDVITFVEATPSGDVNMTTVFADHAQGERSFKAVHSRHVHMPGGPLPSQAYGSCELWD